jgi:hypothetical protein
MVPPHGTSCLESLLPGLLVGDQQQVSAGTTPVVGRQQGRSCGSSRRQAGAESNSGARWATHWDDLPEPDQTDAVRFLGSTFHGYVSLELAGGFRHSPREADASWGWALDTLDFALTNHSRKPT